MQNTTLFLHRSSIAQLVMGPDRLTTHRVPSLVLSVSFSIGPVLPQRYRLAVVLEQSAIEQYRFAVVLK